MIIHRSFRIQIKAPVLSIHPQTSVILVRGSEANFHFLPLRRPLTLACSFSSDFWSSIFVLGSLTNEVTEGRRKLHNEKVQYLYSSPNTKRIKSRKMKWVRYTDRMAKWEMRSKRLTESLSERNHSEDADVKGRIILKWSLTHRFGGCILNSSGSGKRPTAGFPDNLPDDGSGKYLRNVG